MMASMFTKSAFYQKPPTVKTSIEIINEARASLKLVDATRPNTPLDIAVSERNDGVTTLKRFNRLPRNNSFQGNKLDPLPAKLSVDPQNSRVPLHKTASLEDLCSELSHENDKTKRVHSGSSWKGAYDATSSDEQSNTHTLSMLLEEFVLNADKHLEDEKSVGSLTIILLRSSLPIGETLQQHRLDLLKKIFSTLQNREKLTINSKLALAQLAISLGLSESNLTSLCKMVCKLIRSLPQGALFQNDSNANMPAVLLRAITNINNAPSASTRNSENTYEPLVYCLACLKLLTAEEYGARSMAQQNAIKVLTEKMTALLNTIDQSGKGIDKESSINVSMQLLGIFRNLSEAPSSLSYFRTCNTFGAIFESMALFHRNADIILMCSRVLSKASLDHECCRSFVEAFQHSGSPRIFKQNIFFFLGQILLQHCDQKDISVRLAFTIGNIATDHPECVPSLVSQCSKEELPLDLFSALFSYYTTKLANSSSELKTDSTTLLEVTTKTARLLANSAAESSVGLALASSVDFCDSTLRCLAMIDSTNAQQVSQLENLLAAIFAALNNITFHALNSTSSDGIALWQKKLDFASALIPFLMLDHRSSLLLDALHVIANFSRFPDVRKLLSDFRAMDICLALLDANSPQLSYVSCGLLVNFSIDVQSRQPFLDAGGLEKLHDSLLVFANPDLLSDQKSSALVFWPLVNVSCKLILNLIATVKSSKDKNKHVITITSIRNFLTKLQESAVFQLLSASEDDMEELSEHLIPTLLPRLTDIMS